MIIIGIDPGTALTGYAVMEYESGLSKPKIKEVSTIRTSKDHDMHYRLKSLYDGLSDVTKRFDPELMVVERLFFNTNVKTAMTVGQARGVPLLLATALEAKRVLTGYGRSNKKEVQEAVKEFMGLDEVIKPDDANDALAMVLCFINKDYESHVSNLNNV